MRLVSEYQPLENILLIEDNPSDARLVEILLADAELPCHIEHHVTLSAGIAALQQAEYAVVLLDLTLPDSRGFESLERLIEAVPNANVIVLTGLTDKQLGIKAVKSGAQDFLVKGEFDAAQLTKSLRFSIERRNALIQLKQAQAIAHIGNWTYSPDQGTFKASEELYRIFGYTQEQPTGIQQLYSHFFRKDWPLFKAVMETQADEEISKDLAIKRTDGMIRYVSIRSRRYRSPDGLVYYGGILQDITHRKLAEEELRKSQERYRAIFSQTKDAILISNSNGQLVEYNDATIQLLGYSATELHQINFLDLFVHSADRTQFQFKIDRNQFTRDFEAPLLTKDQKVIHCLVSTSLIQMEGFVGLHSIVRDITEQRETAELRKAKAIAEQSARMKEQFLANISHEMRTPMNAILGMSNLLLRTPLNTEQVDYVESVRESSENLLSIINDILEISTLQHGSLQVRKEPFALQPLLHKLTKLMTHRAQEKGLALTQQLDSHLSTHYVGDALRLTQILMNLMGNAIKFTDEGSIALHVKLLERKDTTDEVAIIVSDTGIGIPEDKRDAIFETFVRLTPSKGKVYPGTGLGLSITKQLVELLGGHIKVNSQIDTGTTFEVIVPLERHSPKGHATQANTRPLYTQQLQYPTRILLVEDHKLNQIVARRTLEKQFENVTVAIADNGQIAVEMLENQDFDLVLMDIQMPVMDGYEATAYIRNHLPPPKNRTPIFAMTAHVHMAQEEKFKAYGMDECVLKPFEPNDLFTKISQYINSNHESINSKMESQNPQPQYIDLAYLDLMSDGDLDMKRMMLELLFEEPKEEIQKMKRLCTASDWEELSKVSHKMKSTLAFVGNETLTQTNKQVEQAAKTQTDLDQLPGWLDTIEDLFGKALIELKAVHASL